MIIVFNNKSLYSWDRLIKMLVSLHVINFIIYDIVQISCTKITHVIQHWNAVLLVQ